MKRIVLFDIDGVILRDYNYEKFYENIKCDCSLEKLKEIYCRSDEFFKCEKGLISYEEFWNHVKKATGAQVSVKEYLEIHRSCKGEVYEDSIKLMNKLKDKGYKIGILSNLKSIDISIFKEIIGIENFDYEFYSCNMHYMKPNPEIFKIVAQNLNPLENDIYFIDNLLSNCNEAEKWGIKAINATGFDILEKCKAL